MEALELLRKALREERPVPWNDLPDIPLYMDQVISYLPRQYISAGGKGDLTPAMVNNYIKDGLLPRADGKKYSRIHLCYLTAICALKRVLSVREANFLLREVGRGQTPEHFYGVFCAELNAALTRVADDLQPDAEGEALARTAMAFALRSYADQLVCSHILQILSDKQTPERKPAEKEKAKK